MSPRNFNHTWSITATGGPGTTPQTDDSLPLPPMGPDAEMSVQVGLTALTGGTNPTVAVAIEVSNDQQNWTELQTLGGVDAALSFTANGSKWFVLSSSATFPVPSMRNMWIKATGGGDLAPTAWAVSARAKFTYNA